MTSWGRAFRGAFAIVAFGVLWEIVGILLILTGFGMQGMSLFFNPLGSSSIPWVPQVSGVAGLVLGVVLIALSWPEDGPRTQVPTTMGAAPASAELACLSPADLSR